jgi:hypothetical protein
MHRTTPLDAVFRAYTAGGARSVVHGVDDLKQMQEMAGTFMSHEARGAIESPQNYGFTSVVMDAIKSEIGKVVGSAETFISFMGGNRSFPVAGNMDDRRHRLMDLAKGELAMFGTQGMKQQMHFSQDGMFGSAPRDKTVRMALIDEDSEKDGTSQSFQQQASAPATLITRHVDRRGRVFNFRRVFPQGITNFFDISPLDGSGGGGSSSGSGAGGAAGAGGAGDGMKMGQKALKDKNKKSKLYFDVTKDKTTAAGKEVHLKQDDENTYLHVKSAKVYAGAESGKGKFALVVTLKGPTKNVYGKIG